MKKAHTLITFIGTGSRANNGTGNTGNYNLARYVDPDDPNVDFDAGPNVCETEYICEALVKFAEVERVILLGTQTALDTHLHRINGALRGLGKPDAKPIAVPSCGTAEEAWRIFTIVWRQLNKAADQDSILDITHGFRSQGFLAGAVAAFFRLTNPEKTQPRLVYGAFELLEGKRRGGSVQTAPIVDLTPFIDFIAWAEAILLFQRTGRADPLAKLATKPAETLPLPNDDEALNEGLTTLGEALRKFGPDFETIRTDALLRGEDATAFKLVHAVDAAMIAAQGRQDLLEPLIHALGRVKDFVTPLVDPTLTTLAGLRARPVLAGLAHAYYETGRYPEALTTVREGFVSLLAADAAGKPGAEFDRKERGNAEKHLSLTIQGGPSDDMAERRMLNDLPRYRNDINHGGFNNEPAKGAHFVTATMDMVTLLQNSDLAEGMIRAAARAPERPLFVNLSNHPHATWPEEQRRQARELANGGEILDMPFPAVPDDGADLKVLLKSIEKEIKKRKGNGTVVCAMVQGEYTLTYALVGALQRRGIRCVAALPATRDEPFTFAGFRVYA